MKEIRFIQAGTYKTEEVIFTVLRVPGRAMDLDEMRRRCRILEKLEEAGKNKARSLSLEDADFDIVAQAMKTNAWGVAEVSLLSIVDGILASVDPKTFDVVVDNTKTSTK